MVSDAIKALCTAKGRLESWIMYLEDANGKVEKEICKQILDVVNVGISELENQMFQMKYLREQLEDTAAKIDAKHAKA